MIHELAIATYPSRDQRPPSWRKPLQTCTNPARFGGRLCKLTQGHFCLEGAYASLHKAIPEGRAQLQAYTRLFRFGGRFYTLRKAAPIWRDSFYRCDASLLMRATLPCVTL